MFRRQIARRTGRCVSQVHVLDTQVQTLEDACDIIAAEQHRAKMKKGNAEKRKTRPKTLREEMREAKLRAINLKRHGKISLAGGTSKREESLKSTSKLLPHPLKDLAPDAKRLKAREMFATGAWGTGAVGTRRLALAFRATAEQMAEWLEGILAPP